MTTISLELNIPSDFFILQKQSPQEITRQLQSKVAMLLFRDYHLPATNAAELAGLSLVDFMALVRQSEPVLPEQNPLLQLIGIANGPPLADTIDNILYNTEMP